MSKLCNKQNRLPIMYLTFKEKRLLTKEIHSAETFLYYEEYRIILLESVPNIALSQLSVLVHVNRLHTWHTRRTGYVLILFFTYFTVK